jgi:ABC-type multidrug transport system fused ATPase/permease subunit
MLSHGKVVEDGTYEGLMAKKGLFAGMVERQQMGMSDD